MTAEANHRLGPRPLGQVLTRPVPADLLPELHGPDDAGRLMGAGLRHGRGLDAELRRLAAMLEEFRRLAVRAAEGVDRHGSRSSAPAPGPLTVPSEAEGELPATAAEDPLPEGGARASVAAHQPLEPSAACRPGAAHRSAAEAALAAANALLGDDLRRPARPSVDPESRPPGPPDQGRPTTDASLALRGAAWACEAGGGEAAAGRFLARRPDRFAGLDGSSVREQLGASARRGAARPVPQTETTDLVRGDGTDWWA